MKKVFGAALAAITLFAVSGTAQTTANNSKEVNGTEQACNAAECKKNDCKNVKDCKEKKECKGAKECGKDKPQRKGGPAVPRKGSVNPARFAAQESYDFTTLGLSPEQLEQVKVLNENAVNDRRQIAESIRAERMAAKDSANVKNPVRRDFEKEARQKYLKDLRVILTSDQYVQFLEDNYTSQSVRGPQNGVPASSVMKEKKIDGRLMKEAPVKQNVETK